MASFWLQLTMENNTNTDVYKITIICTCDMFSKSSHSWSSRVELSSSRNTAFFGRESWSPSKSTTYKQSYHVIFNQYSIGARLSSSFIIKTTGLSPQIQKNCRHGIETGFDGPCLTSCTWFDEQIFKFLSFQSKHTDSNLNDSLNDFYKHNNPLYAGCVTSFKLHRLSNRCKQSCSQCWRACKPLMLQLLSVFWTLQSDTEPRLIQFSQFYHESMQLSIYWRKG